MTVWALIHSPLVGRSTWQPVAEVGRANGLEVIVPDLADDGRPNWRSMVSAAADSCSESSRVNLIGHSGAGAFLPQIGRRLGTRLRGTYFVDAILPPEEGPYQTPDQMSEFLDEKTVDGRLAKWFDWWPTGVIEELIPDPDLLDHLRQDCPQLPRSFYEDPIPMPDGWSQGRCAYLRLSEGYAEEERAARHRGWPTDSMDANHLSIVTRPEEVFARLLAISAGWPE